MQARPFHNNFDQHRSETANMAFLHFEGSFTHSCYPESAPVCLLFMMWEESTIQATVLSSTCCLQNNWPPQERCYQSQQSRVTPKELVITYVWRVNVKVKKITHHKLDGTRNNGRHLCLHTTDRKTPVHVTTDLSFLVLQVLCFSFLCKKVSIFLFCRTPDTHLLFV